MVGELAWNRRLFGLWLPLAALTVFALFPFAWMAVTSLKANGELYNPKANILWVQNPSLTHYIGLFTETNFVTWIGNTMLVATVSTIISLVLTKSSPTPQEIARPAARCPQLRGHNPRSHSCDREPTRSQP